MKRRYHTGDTGVSPARAQGAAGFAVTVDPYVKTLGPELISRYGLITEDDLYIGTK